MALFASDPIIVDRAEFAEVLNRLRAGHVLVRAGEDAHGCVVDGAPVYHSFDTLRNYGLIDRYENPKGFPGIEYYRLTPRGRPFAERVWRDWCRRPVLERLVVRLTG